jgi:sulfoxide reductase catalytic subunit YedY
LICAGFFTNHGRWKGISIAELLKLAGADEAITHVSIRGPEGRYAKMERFPIAEIISNQVFLAYQVNGQKLPRKHGFPLRAVAEDHYGSERVKFVHRSSRTRSKIRHAINPKLQHWENRLLVMIA